MPRPLNPAEDFEDDGLSFRQRRKRQLWMRGIDERAKEEVRGLPGTPKVRRSLRWMLAVTVVPAFFLFCLVFGMLIGEMAKGP